MKMDIFCAIFWINGVDAQELQILSSASGHAIIQVDLMVRIASFFMVALMLKMTRTKFYKR